MSNLVIVAIPKEDDYVNKISSEKIPHMTLLFLGEATQNFGVAEMTKFLEHAASFTLQKFWLDVEKRGPLGEDQADVLFFRNSEWNIKTINEFRASLLKNDLIRKAYDSVEQFPAWRPHLTLGYPDSPAKPDDRDYPGISSVYFDKIALWFGDYEGPVFELKDYDWDMEVSMDATQVVEDILHYGVKGQRWGIRKDHTGPVQVTQKKKKLKATGGKGEKASKDAIAKATLAQKKKKSGVNALSDTELQAYARRLQLEQQVKSLEATQRSAPRKFIANLLGTQGKNAANQIASEGTTRGVKKVMEEAAKKGK